MKQLEPKAPPKKAVLLVNLGSPEALTVTAVRRFLKLFLWDPRVVNIPRPIWWLILNGFVLPFRPRKALHGYAKIWTDQGSPLNFLTKQLTHQVARMLKDQNILVDYAMSYSKPFIEEQLQTFAQQGVDDITILPLYPQFSSTTSASVHDSVVNAFKRRKAIPSFRFISDYHSRPEYIAAIADSIQNARQHYASECLVMSFHGLPAKLSEWGDPYAEQCRTTAALIAKQLGLQEHQWKLVFQSRFGKAEWLKPYCIETLMELPKQGIKNIDVVCPGFAVDCLETLEEIAMTNREIFMAAGGSTYHYIPALNDSVPHAQLLTAILKS